MWDRAGEFWLLWAENTGLSPCLQTSYFLAIPNSFPYHSLRKQLLFFLNLEGLPNINILPIGL